MEPAILKGYEPRLYPFNGGDIPAGDYNATLDFKIWAKNTMAVVCYFTLIDIRKKCSLSVFRIPIDKEYRLPESEMDFTTCQIGQLYRIKVVFNGRNKPVLKDAVL